MTRRELREHCFKMLFSANFYDTEEAEQQLDRYFDAPEEDEMDPDGKTGWFIRSASGRKIKNISTIVWSTL